MNSPLSTETFAKENFGKAVKMVSEDELNRQERSSQSEDLNPTGLPVIPLVQ